MATNSTIKADLTGENQMERLDAGQWNAWERQVGKFLGLKPEQPATVALLAVCHRYNLDPLLGHVVVMQDKKPYVTRDGYLHVAHESGQLDGIELIEDPTLIDGEWRAKVSVHRKDMTKPFTYVGRYPANGGNAKYAPEMAIKTAESMALRRAFPVTGAASATERWDDIPEAEVIDPTDATDPLAE